MFWSSLEVCSIMLDWCAKEKNSFPIGGLANVLKLHENTVSLFTYPSLTKWDHGCSTQESNVLLLFLNHHLIKPTTFISPGNMELGAPACRYKLKKKKKRVFPSSLLTVLSPVRSELLGLFSLLPPHCAMIPPENS